MKEAKCIAMILAGGQGSRLGVLTKNIAKPAVPFGGKYRIIDFTLSNCLHSGINTVGVLTQYQPLELNTYIGSGNPWDLNRNSGGVYILPPYQSVGNEEWYKGTANAIFQNMEFIDNFSAEYVVILSGDHIYKMDYSKMVEYHKEKKADATIAVIQVDMDEAKRFGIMSTDSDGRITAFEEKPQNPQSNLASMGVYVFTWEKLKKYLKKDEENPKSSNDFGKNIIPEMLRNNEKLFAYSFLGYWKDVGTIQSLWEANMDIISDPPILNLYDRDWAIFSRNPVKPPHFSAKGAVIEKSCVTEGCNVYGVVKHSILFEGVMIEKGAYVEDSIIFPGTIIGENTVVKKAVIGSCATIGKNSSIGADEDELSKKSPYCSDGITVIEGGINIKENTKIAKESMIENRENLGRCINE